MRYRNISSKKKQLGVSILELVVYIAVASIVIAGAFRYYTAAKDNARVAKVAEEVREIGKAAVTWGQSRTSYTGVSLSTLQSGGYLASNISSNQFGGGYTISGSGTEFTITATSLTTNGCAQAIDMLSQDTTSTPTCTSGTLSATFGT